jgi:hypothetical protein
MIDLPPRHSPVRYGLAHALLAGLSGFVVLVLRGLASFDVRESIAVHDYLAVAQLALAVGPVFVGLYALPRLGVAIRFPRLATASVLVHGVALVLAFVGLALGGLDGARGSWSVVMAFDATRTPDASVLLLASFATMALASVLSSLVVITSTAHEHGASGLLWATRARAAVELVAGPMLLLAVATLTLDRTFGLGLFAPAQGGDPSVWLHLFWAGLHPLLATLALPLLGMLFEGPIGRLPRALFAFAAMTSLLTWGQHLYATGLSPRAATFFSGLSLLATWPLLVLLGHAALRVARRPSAATFGTIALAAWMVFGELRSGVVGLQGLTSPFWFRDGIDGGALVLGCVLACGMREHDAALRSPAAARAAAGLVVGALVLLFVRTWGVSAGPTPLPVALVHLAALLLLLGSIAWLARESFRLRAPRKR